MLLNRARPRGLLSYWSAGAWSNVTPPLQMRSVLAGCVGTTCRKESALKRIAVVVVCLSFADAASASTCTANGGPDLAAVLRTHRDRAASIFLAEVLAAADSLGGPDEQGTGGTVRALEVFKGPVRKGARLELPGGNRSVEFRRGDVGQTFLVYVERGSGIAAACGRTRAIKAGDPELEWLRHQKLPDPPVALRRDTVTCRHCPRYATPFEFSLMRLLKTEDWVPGGVDGASALVAAETWSRFYTASFDGDTRAGELVVMGCDEQRRTWELIESNHFEDACTRIQRRRSCGALWPRARADREGTPPLECAAPGPFEVVCDEVATRQVVTGTPESILGVVGCDWREPLAPKCGLTAVPISLTAGIPTGPVLVCVSENGKDYRCRIDPP